MKYLIKLSSKKSQLKRSKKKESLWNKKAELICKWKNKFKKNSKQKNKFHIKKKNLINLQTKIKICWEDRKEFKLLLVMDKINNSNNKIVWKKIIFPKASMRYNKINKNKFNNKFSNFIKLICLKLILKKSYYNNNKILNQKFNKNINVKFLKINQIINNIMIPVNIC